MMHNKLIIPLLLTFIVLSVAACSDARTDPCKLLSVNDVKEIDDTVTVSLWAGRGGDKKENEVCMFYNEGGDPRIMLFSWYDKNKSPREIVENGAKGSGEIVDIDIPGKEAVATFSEDELRLFAVKSSNGLVGLRVRKPVENDSADFQKLISLSEKALRNLN